MKAPTLLAFFICCFFTAKSSFAQKSLVADSTIWVIDGQLNPYSALLPGDTLLLTEGTRPFIIFKNIIGTPEHPITIINQGGTVEINSDHYFGISIRKSKHIKMTGTGDSTSLYGIRIFNRIGSGLSIGDFSTDFEIEYVEVGNSQYSGIIAKTEPFCGFDRNTFIQENTLIHHCYVHDTGTEGMYIGSTFYAGQTIQCSGVPNSVLPPLLRNVDIHHNRVENTGWDGIQVASAVNTKIHHNQIKHDSQQLAEWQMTGIALGEGSTGEIYNNKIIDGEGLGIYTKGLGDVFIYNNQIIRPGFKNNSPSGKYGIYIEGNASFPGMYFHIINNLIINPKFEGIRFLNAKGAPKNNIQNNVIVQESYLIIDDKASFINTLSQQINVSNNFTTTDMSTVRFNNAMQDDFTVEEGSVLIDGGTNLEHLKIKFDYNEQNRVTGNGIDIGPFESEFLRNNSIDNSSNETAIPNPVSTTNKTTIHFNNPDEGWIEFVLVNQSGGEIKTIDRVYYEEGMQLKTINGNVFQPGLNFLIIRKRMTSSLVKISVFVE
ncbi:MAG: right-handed parallel beta-helix repeat-containing protein [Bacteroidetes bacterium]|nr:right-handed parallel beta-helix repeat-containing protein [Bacteroidota bacterium]